MSDFSVHADTRELGRLKHEVQEGVKEALREAGQRAVEIMRHEVPYDRMRSGISAEFDLRGSNPSAKIIASTIVRSSATGTLHLASGKSRPVKLKPASFDIAETVAKGSGLYGAKGRRITPRSSRVLLIGVDSVPAGESYITAGGKKFIMRPSSSGVKPNPYDERTETILVQELPDLVGYGLQRAGVTG